MRFRHLVLPGVAAFSALALVGACVSLDGVASGGGADVADASDGSVPAADTGVDAGEVPVSTPGEVVCGPTQCSLPSTCCATFPPSPGGAIATKCQAAADTCAGYAVTCDERADCVKGTCCILLGDGGGGGGDRRAACTPVCTSIQACRTDAECLDGKTCQHLTCFGLRLWVCGPNNLCSAN
jgi:hypothetical protein